MQTIHFPREYICLSNFERHLIVDAARHVGSCSGQPPGISSYWCVQNLPRLTQQKHLDYVCKKNYASLFRDLSRHCCANEQLSGVDSVKLAKKSKQVTKTAVLFECCLRLLTFIFQLNEVQFHLVLEYVCMTLMEAQLGKVQRQKPFLTVHCLPIRK